MKNITDWLNSIGIWGLIALLAYALNYVEPLIKKLIESVKTKKLRDGLEIANHLAYNAVTTLASFSNLSNNERKVKAVSLVSEKLAKRGITISDDEISKTVESTYQYMKNNDLLTDKHAGTTQKDDSTASQQAEAVKQILNPQPVDNSDEQAQKIAEQFKNSSKAQQLVKGMNNNGNQQQTNQSN